MKSILASLVAAAAFVNAAPTPAPTPAPTAAPTETSAPLTPGHVSWIFGPQPTGTRGPRVLNVGHIGTLKANGRLCEEWEPKVGSDGVVVPHCARISVEPDHKGNYELYGAKVYNGSCSVWGVMMDFDYVAPKCDGLLNSEGEWVPQMNQLGSDSPIHPNFDNTKRDTEDAPLPEDTPLPGDTPEPEDTPGPQDAPLHPDPPVPQDLTVDEDRPLLQNIDTELWYSFQLKVCTEWAVNVTENGRFAKPYCHFRYNGLQSHPDPYVLVITQVVSGVCNHWAVRDSRSGSKVPWCVEGHVHAPSNTTEKAPEKRHDPHDEMDNDEEDSSPHDSIFNTYSAHQRTTTTDELEVENKVCKKWKVKKLNSPVTPRDWAHFKPECKEWEHGKAYGHQTYTLATVAMHYGSCWADQWDIKSRQNYIEPHCSHWLLNDSYLGDDQIDGYDIPHKKREELEVSEKEKRGGIGSLITHITDTTLNAGLRVAFDQAGKAIMEGDDDHDGEVTGPHGTDPKRPEPECDHYDPRYMDCYRRHHQPWTTETEVPTVVVSEPPHAYSDFVAAANGWDPNRLPVVHFTPVADAESE